jgi:hypothetical protein
MGLRREPVTLPVESSARNAAKTSRDRRKTASGNLACKEVLRECRGIIKGQLS